MNRIQLLWLIALIISLSHLSWATADEADAESLLREARKAIASRDLNTAKAKLDSANAVAASTESKRQVERLEDLLHYVNEFWKSVAAGAARLQPTEELIVGETRTAVVEYDGRELVLRVDGRNRRYNHMNLPGKIALTLAQRALKDGDANNKVIIGAFLAMDSKGNRQMAAQYWREAQQAGVDVSDLTPELDVNLPAVVEVPELTPLMRRILQPNQWTLLVVNEDDVEKIDREEVDDLATVNGEGRLDVTRSDKAKSKGCVVFGRRLSGDFRCRMIVQDVSDGQSFGFFSPTDAKAQFSVQLPAGDSLIELARQRGQFHLKLNGEEAELASLDDDPNKRMAGMLGIRLTPGARSTIAWLEIVGR